MTRAPAPRPSAAPEPSADPWVLPESLTTETTGRGPRFSDDIWDFRPFAPRSNGYLRLDFTELPDEIADLRERFTPEELRKVAEAAPELDFDRADRDHIVGTLVSLGKGLQIPVTAEGVEDNSILETLRTMGDMKGQGYLYGKPEDAAAVMKRLKQLDMLSNMPGAQPEGMERKSA